MTPTRNGTDIYIYEMPIVQRNHLCKIIRNESTWMELATQMGYHKTQIEEIKWSSRHNDFADELLLRWGEQNHTITELFVLLARIKEYSAMNVIKDLVDSRYHRLISKAERTDSKNLNSKGSNKSPPKESTKIPPKEAELSKKILNCANEMISNENNETDNDQSDVTLDPNEYASTIPKIDHKELCSATDNWSENNILGKGGFGTVFKGTWKCTIVAIKRIEHQSSGKNKIPMQQSLNELRYLNSCRHDNILSLYGYSINGDETCLVMQLMQCSLEQRLFRRSSKTPALSWQQRINIAIGTARGLQFLHTFQNNKPLIHGDIKPGNLLLDSCSHPKIADFGLAREGSYDEDQMEVSQVFGTKPYLPDEFKIHRILSTKVDSFSFGVVLFELATCLHAYISHLKKFLIEHVESHNKSGTLIKLIDQSPVDMDESEIIFSTFIALGMKCTQRRPENRLDMIDAYKILRNSFNSSA